MNFQTLITAAQALEHIGDANWAFVDCRFLLSDPDCGFRDYQTAHIKGAVFADLNRELSAPVIPGVTGRHPLPSEESISKVFSSLGIDPQTQVVAYDEAGGHMAAARLWWLLNWAGHQAVAVLNGGFQEWTRLKYPTARGVEHRSPKTFVPHFNHDMVWGARQVQSILNDPSYVLVDSRTNDRYRGENEMVDPVAGHIPGAVNAPFPENVDEAGIFRPVDDLKKRFESLMDGRPPEHTIYYCGSGVTAALNILASVHAGKGMPRLYAGSWSDWITDPTRPIQKGDRSLNG